MTDTKIVMEDDLGPDDILDKKNPLSLYNMVPLSVQQGMDSITPDLWALTELEIEKEYAHGSYNTSINSTIKRLRAAFWKEYDLASKQSRGMKMTNVIRGFCGRTYFREKVCWIPVRMRYLLIPPQDYRFAIEEIVNIGNQQMIDILSADNWTVDKHGNRVFDSRLAGVKEKIWTNARAALHGMPIHRSMQITENLNRNVSYEGGKVNETQLPDFSQWKPEDLEKLIGKLEAPNEAGFMSLEIGEAKEAVDVTPKKGSKD